MLLSYLSHQTVKAYVYIMGPESEGGLRKLDCQGQLLHFVVYQNKYVIVLTDTSGEFVTEIYV